MPITQFFMSLKIILKKKIVGTARGCGWQKLGAYVNLGAYYLVGLPCAIILTFVFGFGGKVRINSMFITKTVSITFVSTIKHKTFQGLWMGIISGSSLQAFLLLVIALRISWDEQVN